MFKLFKLSRSDKVATAAHTAVGEQGWVPCIELTTVMQQGSVFNITEPIVMGKSNLVISLPVNSRASRYRLEAQIYFQTIRGSKEGSAV